MTVKHSGKNIAGTVYLDPGATEYYGFDWSSEIETGETISTNAFSVFSDATKATDASGVVTLSSETIDGTDTKCLVTASSGQVGNTFYLENTITTSSGETHVRTCRVLVKYL